LLGSDARRGLKDHPTVKPTALPEDALLDVSDRGEIVIDPFLGSGSTLIAAQATGRVCRGVELDPLYVDVIVRPYEAATGNHAVLVETGEALDLLAARRSSEPARSRPDPAVSALSVLGPVEPEARAPPTRDACTCGGPRFESPQHHQEEQTDRCYKE
jgi:hypothetical protein